MADLNISGIYEIVNVTNGKRYVGSAVNIRQRWRKHRNHLKAGTHHNAHLSAAWRKYGEEKFRLRVICACPLESLVSKEQEAIDSMKPEYNKSPCAGSQLGYRHTDETRAKMSASRRKNPSSIIGYKFSEEARANMAKAHVGNRHTDETRAKMSAMRVGNSYRLGAKDSDESRARKSAAQKVRWAKWRADRAGGKQTSA